MGKDYRDDYLSAAIAVCKCRNGPDHVLAFLTVLYDQIGDGPMLTGERNPYERMAAEITRAYTLNRAEVSA